MKTTITFDRDDIHLALKTYVEIKMGVKVNKVTVTAHPDPDAGDPRSTGPYVTAEVEVEGKPERPKFASSMEIQRGD